MIQEFFEFNKNIFRKNIKIRLKLTLIYFNLYILIKSSIKLMGKFNTSS